MDIIDDNFEFLFNNVKVSKKKFDFFDIISPKEMIVSEWLSFIFDPSRNGVGNATITKLLEAIDMDYDLDSIEFISTDVEVSTDEGRRIDIIIKYKGLWIIIENKLDSTENNVQTKDYYKYIEKIKSDNKVIYVYLKPNYNKSQPTEKKFIVLTYGKLFSKLKGISEFEYNDKSKYKYLKEFILSGDRFMRKEELDYNEVIQFYINNKDKMELIENEYKMQNKRLHEKLRYDILNMINDKREDYVTDDHTSITPRNYIQYYQKHWYKEKYNIHFELMFPSEKILAKNIKCDIVLHIEGKNPTEVMNKLKKYNISKNKSKSLANINGEPIKTVINIDFSNEDNYEKSILYIKEELVKLIDKYEKIINDVIR